MLTVNFPSLSDRLRRSVVQTIRDGDLGLLSIESLSSTQVPLKGRRGGLPICYRSAIALKLAPRDALAFAEAVATHWQGSEYALEVTPPGWLDFRVCDGALANWLQVWADGTIRGTAARCTEPKVGVDVPFAVQYAHARCQSLLRLGHREGWIELGEGGIATPQPLPWLNEAGVLSVTDLAEAQLIARCVAVADGLAEGQQPDCLKLLMGLSEALEDFSRDCPPVERSPLRLGLLSVTGSLLFWLLEVGLGIEAISEM